MPFILA